MSQVFLVILNIGVFFRMPFFVESVLLEWAFVQVSLVVAFAVQAFERIGA